MRFSHLLWTESQLICKAKRKRCRIDTCRALIGRDGDAVIAPAGPGICAYIVRNDPRHFHERGRGFGVVAFRARRVIESKFDAALASVDHMLHVLVLTVQRLCKFLIREGGVDRNAFCFDQLAPGLEPCRRGKLKRFRRDVLDGIVGFFGH